MTDPTGPDDSPTLPNVYARRVGPTPPPPGFWEGLRPPPAPPGIEPASAQPGSTGQAASGAWAGPTAAAAGDQPAWSFGWEAAQAAQEPPPAETAFDPPYRAGAAGIVVPSSAPDRDARRRGALLAVAGVVLATVIVVLATVVIGPHLRPSGNNTTNDVAPPTSLTGTATSASDPPTSSSSSDPPTSTSPPLASIVPPTAGSATTAGTAASGATTQTSTKQSGTGGTNTVTVGGTGSSTGSATVRTTTSSGHSAPPVVLSTIQPSTTSRDRPSSPPPPGQATSSQVDFGVPTREIPCSNGLIVQLASELTPQDFQGRVSTLQSQGLVPGDAAAATTAGSCGIFSGQQNTYVLYSGPFGDLRDACNDRLSGPYDAYIKGGNPGTAGSFYSCICPAKVRQLPTVSQSGQTSQWIGELQRMLGAHLRYTVGGLGNSGWGVYTDGTRAAVQRFQSDHQLKPTGVVDEKTWAAIQSAGC